jgi:hypothetical protein
MNLTGNPRQIVLRRDTATGLTRVGWETDLPIGRFEHIELICEQHDNHLPLPHDSENYSLWQQAISRAREANTLFIQQQIQQLNSKGWWPIPFELSSHRGSLSADEFGNYSAAAMQLLFELTRNVRDAWAVIVDAHIVHVRSRQPLKTLDVLPYQVWYHQQQSQLASYGGHIIEGQLQTCESGLWLAR